MARAQHFFTDRLWLGTTVLAALAGIIYNSWLLGYWLNPAVAKAGLASEFEALHQPYNWLFIGGDVVCSLIVAWVCWLLWRRVSPSARRNKIIRASFAGLIVFAVGTVVDTLLPMGCEPSLQRCPNFTQDHLLLAHGIFSIAAALGLFVSLLLFWWRDRRSWLLNILLFGYVLFGLFSLADALQPVHQNWSQHYYLLLCGLWLACVPHAVWRFTVISGNIAAPEAKVGHHGGKH